MSKTALVVGASGETGKEVVKHLAASSEIAKVILINRRNLDLPAEGADKVYGDYNKE